MKTNDTFPGSYQPKSSENAPCGPGFALHSLCLHFVKGRCRFGDRCRYSHDVLGILRTWVENPEAPLPKASATLRVLSYNVLGQANLTNHVDEMYRSVARDHLMLEHRVARMIAEVAALHPDVVCMQVRLCACCPLFARFLREERPPSRRRRWTCTTRCSAI